MHHMNEILDQKKGNLSSPISSMLEIYNRRLGKPIRKTGYSTMAQKEAELKEKRKNVSEGTLPNQNNHMLTICMDGEDWLSFTSLSNHMGTAPSIMALIILKQAILYAKDRKELDGFLLSHTSPSPKAPHLFPRKLEILNLIAKGHSNREIAESLRISERTVKNHISSIMRKLKAQNRTHAVIMAQQYHLI